MRIKICGVTRPQDARLAAKLGAWAVGMIFVPNTPRFLTIVRAKKVRAAIPKGVLAVGVFRGASVDVVLMTAKALNLDAVQFDGRAPRVPGLRVIRVVEPRRTLADRRAGRVPSASARRAAVRRARGQRALLGGGLTPENVAEAAAGKPWGLDVSSGVERRPGIKDVRKMRAFFVGSGLYYS